MQFAVCRVGMGVVYWSMMVRAVSTRPGPLPGWAAAGVALFGALVALNAYWLAKWDLSSHLPISLLFLLEMFLELKLTSAGLPIDIQIHWPSQQSA